MSGWIFARETSGFFERRIAGEDRSRSQGSAFTAALVMWRRGCQTAVVVQGPDAGGAALEVLVAHRLSSPLGWDPAPNAPPHLENRNQRDWDGDWDALPTRWTEALGGLVQAQGGPISEVTLRLQRRDLWANDQQGAQLRRLSHSATLLLRAQQPGAASATLGIPLTDPVPVALEQHAARCVERARLHAVATRAEAGHGLVVLRPQALAQALASGVVRRPAAEVATTPPAPDLSALNLPVDIFEADTSISIPPGTFNPSQTVEAWLDVLQLDEIIHATTASAVVHVSGWWRRPGATPLACTGLRLELAAGAIAERLADHRALGISALGTLVRSERYFVPSFSLGPLRWRPG